MILSREFGRQKVLCGRTKDQISLPGSQRNLVLESCSSQKLRLLRTDFNILVEDYCCDIVGGILKLN